MKRPMLLASGPIAINVPRIDGSLRETIVYRKAKIVHKKAKIVHKKAKIVQLFAKRLQI